ncbi:hypothetical protein ACFL96_19485 [Thermoproteota archaeon]
MAAYRENWIIIKDGIKFSFLMTSLLVAGCFPAALAGMGALISACIAFCIYIFFGVIVILYMRKNAPLVNITIAKLEALREETKQYPC